MSHQITRVKDDAGQPVEGEYLYRGHTLHRHDDVPNGYWGRWSVGLRAHTDDTRQNCVKWIDARLKAQEGKR
jgi:hypothetical protein